MATQRPNLLLIMTDQQKATSLGLYGNPDVRTPYLERLASEGVQFDQAYTPQPLCVPARVSFWTGRYPHQHGARTALTFLPPRMDHYLARLDDAGYTLGLIGKNHCFERDNLARFDTLYEAYHSGPVDAEGDPSILAFKEFMRQRRHDYAPTHDVVCPLPPGSCTTGVLAERAERFIAASRRESRPWALWLSFPDPHPPYQAPEPYCSRFDADRITMPPWDPTLLATKPERLRVVYELMRFRTYTEADMRRLVATYYAMIAFVDDAVGRVLGALEEAGQSRDTIVVFVSDHGDYAGEHGMVEKWGGFYDCLTRVPLLLRFPRQVPGGQRCPALVSTHDVLATCFALAGLEGPLGVSARPLPAPYIPGGGAPRDAVVSEWGAGGPVVRLAEVAAYGDGPGIGTWAALAIPRAAQGRAKMLRTGLWKYCWDPLDPDNEGRELYDLEADPWELHNLAHDPGYAETCVALEHRLLRWSVVTEDAEPRPLMYDLATLRNSEAPQYAPAEE